MHALKKTAFTVTELTGVNAHHTAAYTDTDIRDLVQVALRTTVSVRFVTTSVALRTTVDSCCSRSLSVSYERPQSQGTGRLLSADVEPRSGNSRIF